MHAVLLLTKSSLPQDNVIIRGGSVLAHQCTIQLNSTFGKLHLGMLLASELTSVPSAETYGLCVTL
jgi:hypothetical protein